MTFLMCLGFVYLVMLLHDLEGEPPLFNPQNSGTMSGYAYYLCYRYPRPRWYVERMRRLLEE